MTLVGTSPNIIVSRVREQLTGEPFGMFDYTPVGLGLAIMGIIFLRFGYRLLPRDRRAAPTLGEALDVRDYTTAASIGPESSLEGTTVARSEEHTSELPSLMRISYAVFCLKKKK